MEIPRWSGRDGKRFLRLSLGRKTIPEDLATSPTPDEIEGPPASRTQLNRLIRLTRPGGFEKEVKKLPNGQKYIDRHNEVVAARRRGENSDFLRRRLD